MCYCILLLLYYNTIWSCQALGASNSAYSLADQHGLNVTFSSGSSKATLGDVEEIVDSMRSEWGVLSICDIVLNHTANETPWLREHPEASYNLFNCPHLRPAFIMDRVIKRWALRVMFGVGDHLDLGTFWHGRSELAMFGQDVKVRNVWEGGSSRCCNVWGS